MTRLDYGISLLTKVQLSVIGYHRPGQPFYSLHWILGMWNAHLPEVVRKRFRNLTVGELIAHPVEHYLAEDFNAKLSDDGKWILASTTAMLVRKPADSR